MLFLSVLFLSVLGLFIFALCKDEGIHTEHARRKNKPSANKQTIHHFNEDSPHNSVQLT